MASEEQESKAIVPPEMINEILYRLPSKSVCRFRCVSKVWLSLLTDPAFMKTHQNTLNRNHLLCYYDRKSLYSLPFNHHEEDAVLKPLPLDLSDFNGLSFHGSCNGLVLVFVYHVYEFFKVRYIAAFVGNPTTSEFVELAVCTDEVICGIGYDCVKDDYKVVSISKGHHNYDPKPVERMYVRVYSLRTCRWKVKGIDSPFFRTFHEMWNLQGVFVNGCLNFIAKKNGGSDDGLPIIVAFNFEHDKFIEVPFPNLGDNVDIMSMNFGNNNDDMPTNDVELVVFGGKLAIFLVVQGEVWLMNEYGVSDSWIKVIIHGFNPTVIAEPTIIHDNKGKILLATNNGRWTYDIEARSFSETVEIRRDPKLMVKGAYIESVVSPKHFRNSRKGACA